MPAKTLFEKVWDRHVVAPETPDQPAILAVDLHLIHEVTSPQAFAALKERGLKVRRPGRTRATMDHSTPTTPLGADGRPVYITKAAKAQVEQLEQNCAEHGIELHSWNSPDRGIVHVIGPELGLTRPGMTIVCGDSHTSTHGAFGAIAFGIGTSEVSHVLATQCLLQRKPKTMRVTVNGAPPPGVSAKDIVLAIIAKIGIDGGTGSVLEYAGDAIRALDMEGRMTVCNMTIEGGAKAGMIAPDETTFSYLKGRKYTPFGADWDRVLEDWSGLHSDADAVFDQDISLDATTFRPMITFGTTPDAALAIDAPVPEPTSAAERRALDYMQFTVGKPVLGSKVGTVFIGSCTNGRLSDLRAAADVLKGRKVSAGVRMLVVPGSEQVKQDAEREGLDKIFLDAGAEWRETGCSMCIAMNGDFVKPGELAVSTSNRNFEGRQGKGARTVLANPATAAAAATAGEIIDPRTLMEN